MSQSNFPISFDSKTYAKWHEKTFPQDKNLLYQIDQLRDKLFYKAKSDLVVLNALLKALFTNLEKEYRRENNIDTSFQTPLANLLKDNKDSGYREKLFKGTTSIVEKMWRKNNQDNPQFSFSKIETQMTDLVRTEIICKSLDACKFLSDKLNSVAFNSREGKIKELFNQKIDRIESEPELKMASGYFAYHSLIYFNSGLIVEVQIHSSLSSSWRKLSHDLYKTTRLSPIVSHDYGSIESRIISLGHLLHIADFELDRLEKEFNQLTFSKS
ncbi:MAG: hypothetical protein ABI723_06130 [Bacteroidia bacterium]